MGRKWRCAVMMAAFACFSARGADAAVITFDLETVAVGTFAPFAQTVNGATATFSTTTLPGYSVQVVGAPPFFNLSLFSGRYVFPDSVSPGPLSIQFSQPVDSVSLTFATIETHTPSSVVLDAFMDAAAVGSITGAGTFIPGDTYPQGTLTFSSASPFNIIRLTIPPFQDPEQALAYMVDTIVVNTVDEPPPPAVPEPGTLLLLAAGIGALAARRRA